MTHKFDIYHTSPEPIIEIKSSYGSGVFGDVLFFSDSVYSMCVGDYITYKLEADENEIVGVSELYDAGIIEEIRVYFKTDSDTAERLLQDEIDVMDVIDDVEEANEASWYIQAQQGQCAKKMGYLGAMGTDEQGCVYMIPMLGLEHRLQHHEECDGLAGY